MSFFEPNIFTRIRLKCAHEQYKKRNEMHTLHQLFWECTLRCNLNCQHCGSDCRTNSNTEDMPLEDFLKVLDDIRLHMDSNNILVVTTGGEPLVRKDLCICGEAIRARGFHWGMVSNGMLLDEQMCDRLLKAGLETIAISFDGFEDAHNWLRGNKNSFAMAEKAIKTLVGKKITWDVITCVNKKNINDLENFKQYLIKLGVRDWRIFTVVPMGRASVNKHLYLTRKQFCNLMDFIVKVRNEGEIRVSYGCESFLGKYEWKVRDYPYFCQAGINVASILADGSISGCLSIRSQYHQGNIYSDIFSDIWSKKFKLYREREWMRTNKCASCNVWKFCKGNGMHLRDNNGNLLICHYKSDNVLP